MENMLSKRGKKLIVIDNYTFRRAKETSSGILFRCTNKNCKMYINTDPSEQIAVKRTNEHNHLPTEKLEVKKLQNTLKRKATNDIADRPSKIINRGVKESHANLTIKDVEAIRKSIYRSRRSILPPLPKSISDVHDAVAAYECKTNKSENFLLINERHSNIILFSCMTNLIYLCSRPKLYVDGTFDYCVKFFKQFFTIHSIENGHYIPLVFILLPNKLAQTYFEAFKLLHNYCQEQNLNLEPKEIVCDFEKAIHVSVTKLWPNIKLIGCRFHLTQAWFRKIQELGLVTEYKNKDSDYGKWLKWTFGLIYLDHDEVENCFVEDLYAEIPANKRIIEYADYLVDNYISEASAFEPEMWASCNSTTERTTNACESFHSKFNANFYVTHPDIFKFVEALKDTQISTYIKINSVNLPVGCTNTKYKKRHANIYNLINLYKSRNISRFDFVKAICYQCCKN